jgi:hypothetical protein
VNAKNQSTVHAFWFWWLRMHGHVAVRSSPTTYGSHYKRRPTGRPPLTSKTAHTIPAFETSNQPSRKQPRVATPLRLLLCRATIAEDKSVRVIAAIQLLQFLFGWVYRQTLAARHQDSEAQCSFEGKTHAGKDRE